MPFFSSTFRACEDDINGICRCNCKSLKENNILRHNWVSFWGKGPSFERPSACPSFTCWSYLYFESSCFEQDLLQLSFLKNKQQFAGNFKYHHTLSLFITLQCLTRVCFDNWRSNPSDKEFGLKFPCLEQPPSREARTRGWEVEEVDQKPA